MQVKRIVANLPAADPQAAQAFYRDVFGLKLEMDHGWLQTFTADAHMTVQMSVASQGGSGTPVPAVSIEVDDLDEALARVRRARAAVEYGPVEEPWGVRRFFVRDPLGHLINVLVHL